MFDEKMPPAENYEVTKEKVILGPILVDDGVKVAHGRRVDSFALGNFTWRGHTDNQNGMLSSVFFRTQDDNIYLIQPIRDSKDVRKIVAFSILDAKGSHGMGRERAEASAVKFEIKNPNLILGQNFSYTSRIGFFKKESFNTPTLTEIISIQSGTIPINPELAKKARESGQLNDIAKEFWQSIEQQSRENH